MGKIDMTGWVMKEHGIPNSKLTVLYETPERRHNNIIWHCKCECGNECNVEGVYLRNGTTKSCGCYGGKIDMTGWIMKEHGVPESRWTVLYELSERASNRGIIWHCKCDCGTERDVDGYLLRSGQSKSCGCLHKEIVKNQSSSNLKIIPKGTRFGRLTVIERSANNNQGRSMWKCKCDCGNEVDVSGVYLRNGTTQSCGCLRSKGEFKIAQLLIENNITFEKEKSFDNCRFEDTMALARFDFYIDNRYIIEYDGNQHFEAISGWNTKENLIKTQEHDKIKNQYCFKNNIPIIRIPYIRYDNLCLEDLIPETSKFLVE